MAANPPLTLSGWSAMRLFARGAVAELIAFVMVWPIALESRLPGGGQLWGPLFVSLVIIFGVGGGVLQIRSFSKGKQEISAGYTSVFNAAVADPALYYLDGRDLTVISSALEVRPRNGTRKSIEAFRRNRYGSGYACDRAAVAGDPYEPDQPGHGQGPDRGDAGQ